MAVRVGFGILALGIFLWGIFVFPLAVQIMHYRSYTSSVYPNELRWTTLPIHEELWRPVAHFGYTVNAKEYDGYEVFQGGLYRTPYAADVAIKAINNSNPVVWYSPSNPAQATIEKFFPFKKILYAIITLLLIIYTAWAGYYLTDKFYRKG
jgi:hypothetical protein